MSVRLLCSPREGRTRWTDERWSTAWSAGCWTTSSTARPTSPTTSWRCRPRPTRPPRRHDEELAALFLDHPVVLCLSGALPRPGSYLAVDLCGTPVLLTRDGDGRCGPWSTPAATAASGWSTAPVRPAGSRAPSTPGPTTRRPASSACPWPVAFEGMCREDKGLVELPVAEGYGLVVGRLRPGPGRRHRRVPRARTSPTSWPCWTSATWEPFNPLHVHPVGANWKVTLDTYRENYHFDYLHRTTLKDYAHGGVLTFDAFGPAPAQHVGGTHHRRAARRARGGVGRRPAPPVAPVRPVPQHEPHRRAPARGAVADRARRPRPLRGAAHRVHAARTSPTPEREAAAAQIPWICDTVVDGEDFWVAGAHRAGPAHGRDRHRGVRPQRARAPAPAPGLRRGARPARASLATARARFRDVTPTGCWSARAARPWRRSGRRSRPRSKPSSASTSTVCSPTPGSMGRRRGAGAGTAAQQRADLLEVAPVGGRVVRRAPELAVDGVVEDPPAEPVPVERRRPARRAAPAVAQPLAHSLRRRGRQRRLQRPPRPAGPRRRRRRPAAARTPRAGRPAARSRSQAPGVGDRRGPTSRRRQPGRAGSRGRSRSGRRRASGPRTTAPSRWKTPLCSSMPAPSRLVATCWPRPVPRRWA